MCRCGHSLRQHQPADADVFTPSGSCSTCSCDSYQRGADQPALPFASTKGLPKKWHP